MMTTREINDFMYEYTCSVEDAAVRESLREVWGRASAPFRFHRRCNNMNCAFHADGGYCKSADKHCVPSQNLSEAELKAFKALNLVPPIPNADVPLHTIFKCLLRDYKREQDENTKIKEVFSKKEQELKAEIYKLQSQLRVKDEQLEVLGKFGGEKLKKKINRIGVHADAIRNILNTIKDGSETNTTE